MKNNNLKSDVYNQEWLQSAWGEQSTQNLINQTVITPRPRIAKALELVKLDGAEINLLDIACGRGEVCAIAGLYGIHAVGIDFSATALKVANQVKRNIESKKHANISLIQADACSLPFADESFDRITILDIIEHLMPEQLETMFKEVRRLLKPNGYVVLHTLPNRWVYNITFPLLRIIFKRLPRNPRGKYDQLVHVNEQDLLSLHNTLEKLELAHYIWLEQLMPAQASWNAGNDQYGDNRDTVYPLLAGKFGRLLVWLSLTPAKLLLSNDIYGIIWKGNKPSISLPLSLTERFVCFLFGRK